MPIQSCGQSVSASRRKRYTETGLLQGPDLNTPNLNKTYIPVHKKALIDGLLLRAAPDAAPERPLDPTGLDA